MINWVLQVERQPVGKLVQQSFWRSTLCQTVQNYPIQTQSNLSSIGGNRTCFLWIKEKRPVHKRSMKGVCIKNFGSSDRSGKLVKLSEDIRVMQCSHDGTGELAKSSASTHIVKEQFVPAEHRDNASRVQRVLTVQSTRRTLTSTFQKCRIRQ